MVQYASNGIMVFIPCNTVLVVYVPQSMAQVRTKPPYIQVCACMRVCVYVYEWTDVHTHT